MLQLISAAVCFLRQSIIVPIAFLSHQLGSDSSALPLALERGEEGFFVLLLEGRGFGGMLEIPVIDDTELEFPKLTSILLGKEEDVGNPYF